MAKIKDVRNMKVHESSGYRYKSTPQIMLKGDWLKAFGFDMGMQIVVKCEDGKLVITPADGFYFENSAVMSPVSMVAETPAKYEKKRKQV